MVYEMCKRDQRGLVFEHQVSLEILHLQPSLVRNGDHSRPRHRRSFFSCDHHFKSTVHLSSHMPPRTTPGSRCVSKPTPINPIIPRGKSSAWRWMERAPTLWPSRSIWGSLATNLDQEDIDERTRSQFAFQVTAHEKQAVIVHGVGTDSPF